MVSAGVSTGRVGELLTPMRVTLRHQREEGVSSPICVQWKVSGRVWGEEGCDVEASNSTHTTTTHCTKETDSNKGPKF